MNDAQRTWPRVYFGALAAISGFGLLGAAIGVVQAGRSLVNYFSYFTVQSNLLVFVTAVVVAVTGTVARRWDPVLLAALVGISVTGAVYHLVLAGQVELAGMEVVYDLIHHTLVPLGAVIGFVVLRRPLTSHAWWFLCWPVLWLAWTLLRAQVADPRFAGPDDSFIPVPYDFLDAAAIGWGPVIRNALLVTMLMLVLGWAYVALSRRFGRVTPRAGADRTSRRRAAPPTTPR